MAWSAPVEKPTPDQEPKTTVAKLADLPSEAVDLTDKVEVTVQGTLKSTSRTAHSATILVKNTSKDDLQGPIIVLVDQTGIEALQLDQPNGTLSDDRPYVEIVNDKGELKAGKSLKPQKLLFSTKESIAATARRQFDLKVRVCRLDKALAEANKKDGSEKIEGKSYSWKDFDKVAAIQEKWTLPLLQQGQKQVYGTAITENEKGELQITAYTQRTSTGDLLPDTVDGIPVHVKVVGQMFRSGPAEDDRVYENNAPRRAMRGNENDVKAMLDNGPVTPQSDKAQPLPTVVDPTVRFNRPVPIGVSIGNLDRLLDVPDTGSTGGGTGGSGFGNGAFNNLHVDPICFAGTLGCRCVDSLGTQYILTNLHVAGGELLTPETEPFFMIARVGDRMVQPGTLDAATNCTEIDADIIGTVADYQENVVNSDAGIAFLNPNRMDAAIIKANPGAVGALPPVNGYQTLKRDVMNRPYIGMPVQKFGRTTLYTAGTVNSLNASTFINIDAQIVSFFTRQIFITNPDILGQTFDAAGDSGSLIVAKKPGSDIDGRPVALLYAGGGALTIASPIGPILKRFGVQIDDGKGAPYQAGVSGTMGGAITPHNPPSPGTFLPPTTGGGGGGGGGNGTGSQKRTIQR